MGLKFEILFEYGIERNEEIERRQKATVSKATILNLKLEFITLLFKSNNTYRYYNPPQNSMNKVILVFSNKSSIRHPPIHFHQ